MITGPRPILDTEFEALIEFNALQFSDAAAVRRVIMQLADPECLVVMTGQQAGLFLGPLFTITKAINAIQLAKRLEERTGRPAVPIFWIASDDHDFAEIAHLSWTDTDGARRHFQIDQPLDTEGHCVGPLPIDADQLLALLEDLRAQMPPSEFRDGILDMLSDAVRDNSTIGDLFRELLLRVLQPHGLVVVDPWFAPLKRLLPEVIACEISEPGGLTERVLEASESLMAAGHTPQVHRHAGAVNLFLVVDGVRARLEHSAGRFNAIHPATGETLATHSGVELLEMLRRRPERFSPNVVTKPLIRDHVFRPAAYIAGPGELSYYAQFKSAYGAVDVPMPIIVPRSQSVLVSPPVRRALERLDLTAEAWLGMDAKARSDALLRRSAASDRIERFERDREALLRQIDALESSVAEIDPGLRRGVEKMRSSTISALERLTLQLAKSAQQRDEQLTLASARLENALMPGGEPQERADNLFIPHLLRHGPGLIGQIFATLDPENPLLQTVEIA